MIAELHLSWFEYPKAAAIWRMLGLAKNKSKSTDQVIYLQQLASLWTKQYQPAVTVKQQLVKFNLNEQQFTQIPALRLEIASDYEALGQLVSAFQNYQDLCLSLVIAAVLSRRWRCGN